MPLQCVTLNVNGLRSNTGAVPKRRNLFTWLKRLEADIIFLQETHAMQTDENWWSNEWGRKCYFSNGDNLSRGVAILFRIGLQIEVMRQISSSNGRYLILEVSINGCTCALGTVYGPNLDKPEVYQNFFNDVNNVNSELIVIGGDFNLCLNLELDRVSLSSRVRNNDRCKRVVEQFIQEAGLVDIWRRLQPSAREFTCIKETMGSKSRIDFFLVSENLLHTIPAPEANIANGFLTDHSLVTIKINIGQTITGRSYWKFNNKLLVDDEFVKMMQTRIPEIIRQNDTPDTSKTVQLCAALCVLRGEIIAYSSRKKKERNAHFTKLEAKINNSNEYSHDDIAAAIAERDELIAAIAKSNMFRCKTNWRRYAEKGTQYFHGLQKRDRFGSVQKAMQLTHTQGGIISGDTSDMLEECRTFFRGVFTEQMVQTMNGDELSLLPRLTSEQHNACDLPLSESELKQAVFGMRSSSSPGPDGFTAPFYKVFWLEIKNLLLQAIREIERDESMPPEMHASITILIPKKGKDPKKVENLRPISLLNVVYKIVTKTIATRLAKVIPDLIDRDQTGFIKGRFIGENIRLILDILYETEYHEIPGLLLFCDWKMAYDSVNWDYLKVVVEAYGFGTAFRSWINILYDSNDAVNARIQINGTLSSPYVIKRGLRQGCPLSCLLFLLCIEPLAVQLRADDCVTGLNFNGEMIKISSYADDTTLILDGSSTSLKAAYQSITRFEQVSGLTLNAQKSRAMWIGKNKDKTGPDSLTYGFNWEKSPVDFLGVKIDPNSLNWIGENYQAKIEGLKRKLSPWLKRSLTPFGRIYLVKSEALSQLTYLMTVLPKPNDAQIKEIESIIFRFVWGGKTDKVKRSTLKNTFCKGGMRMPDVATQANSLKVKWVKQFMSEESTPWKSVMYDKLTVRDRISLFHCRLSDVAISGRELSQFWVETLTAWKALTEIQCETETERSPAVILSEVIWNNCVLQVEDKIGGHKTRLIRAGVCRIDDLYDIERSRLMTSIELTRKYNVGHFLVWQCILSSIPREWKSKLSNHRPKFREDDSIVSHIESLNSTAKWAYLILLRQIHVTTPDRARVKWQQELGGNLQDDNVWENMFTSLYKLTDDFKLKWLQMQIFHRILPTARLLHLYGVTDTDACTFCKTQVETITHLFWHCRKVNAFWRDVTASLMSSHAISLVQVVMNTSLPGRDDSMQLLIILLGKQYIWRSRCLERRLSVNEFKQCVKAYYDIELFIARANDQVTRLNEMWKCILLKL